MKLKTQKPPFCGDFSIIKSIRLASISSLLAAFLLILSSTFLINFNSFANEKNNQIVPAKKSAPAPAKSKTSSKIVKSKKVIKSKKRVVIKKDTLLDIDPATANSPLYNN